MGNQCEDLERGPRETPTQRRKGHTAPAPFKLWEPQAEVVRCVTHLLPAWEDSGRYGEEAQTLRETVLSRSLSEARASCPLLLVPRSPPKHLWVNMAYSDFYTRVLRVLWAYI